MDFVARRTSLIPRSLSASITGKENISTTYGEHNYIKQINQYKLIMQIGEGSFSKVFLAIDTNTSQFYATKRLHIKKLSKTAIGVSQLNREILMMRKLNHPHIVSLHEVIHVKPSGVVYIIEDYADCGNLASIIKSGVKFNNDQIRYIFRQIAEGVCYLHENGIVHQDLKPQNILMKHDGTALISDFGIGHTFQSSAKVVGTPAFQAPELIDKCSAEDEISPGSEDIWSLGVTLYNLCFQRFPFSGQNVFEIVRSIMSSKLKMPEGCDPILWDLIIQMLNVDNRSRYNIHQVMAHEYVANAPQVEIRIAPFVVPPRNRDLPIRAVEGIVCDENYVFDVSERQLRVRRHEFSAPFQIPQ
ncbi:CAMK family protein kinase [Tritrichomonas foetus]|uniref:CAMK family protein kinase n=1 Tax=Tritrichomonas foetus TaxID=1144522 RepID=A0A1J4KIT8_9EUKA|nr:CAMK family protein kinase [Tritrichomonas foetus]|eukprot:OHT11147.1 CAMK family protein kinase [Tritrichomonas foetus]